MLESYSEGALSRAKFLKTGKDKYFKTFQVWVMDLFGWLEVKIDFTKKEFKCLKKLQKYMNKSDATKMTYKDWCDCWFALRVRMDTLGITKIEMEEEDVYTLLKRP